MDASITWGSSAWVYLEQEPYCLESVTGPLTFGNSRMLLGILVFGDFAVILKLSSRPDPSGLRTLGLDLQRLLVDLRRALKLRIPFGPASSGANDQSISHDVFRTIPFNYRNHSFSLGSP